MDRKYRMLREYVAEMADKRKSLDNIEKKRMENVSLN